MRENPVITDEHFDKMQNLATNLNQVKCIQQSDFAQKRCQETQSILQKKMDQLRAMLVSRRPTSAQGRPEQKARRTSLHDMELSGAKAELIRRVHNGNDPKQHRDSLYSNGSVDSGISVGDKTPTSPDGSNEPVKRKPVATIRPISEIITSERRTMSLERLDEGYEENEQSAVEKDIQKTYSPVRRRANVSRKSRPSGTHLASRQDVPPTPGDEEFRVSDEEGEGQVGSVL